MRESPLDPQDPLALAARLREAREGRGWTQQQLAERLQMARTTVVAIEKGERRLKPQELLELAALLGESVSDLLQRGAPVGSLIERFRGSLSASPLPEAELAPHLRELQRCAEDYLRLEAICKAPLSQRYPPEYPIRGLDAALAAEDLAASERNRLGLGEGPLMNLREILESDIGLRIFQLELPPPVTAIFTFAAPLGGCIAVNLRLPAERRRIDLARAFAVFLTARHRSEVAFAHRSERRSAAERFSEGFARAFLAPAAGLRRRFLELDRERLQGLTHGDLCRLAVFYRLPVEAMTHRLEEVRLVPAGTWDRLEHERPQAGNTRLAFGSAHLDDEPFSNRYVALAVEAWQLGELSEGQLARVLRTDRLGARAAIERVAPAATDGDDSIELAAPLVVSRR